MQNSQQISKARLLQNKEYLEECIPIMHELYERKEYEDCLGYIEKIAAFCWWNFPGSYYSMEMEVLLAEMGKLLFPFDKSFVKKREDTSKRKLLHICSEVYTTGGHSKLLYNWIKCDNSSDHTLLSTRTNLTELELITKRYLGEEFVHQIALPNESYLGRAQALKNELYEGYDLIILHIHPDECLCNLAFSDPTIEVPILFVNHADHVFWIGSYITQILIQLRKPFITLDIERRQIEETFYLPLPITNPNFNKNYLPENSSSEDDITILSIGNEVKYEPNDDYNFYEECILIVETHKNVRIKIIGISPNGIQASKYVHERIDYLGPLEYELLEEYRRNCNIYIEGFPMPSFTATLETILFKKPAVLHYNPKQVFRQFTDDDNGLVYSASVDEWRKNIDRIILEKESRNQLACIQYEFVLKEFALETWEEKLQPLYKKGTEAKRKNLKFVQKFYDGENEAILANFTENKVDHLYLTTKLSFKSKIKMVTNFSRSVKNKTYKISFKTKLKYLIPRMIKAFLKKQMSINS